MQVVFLDHLNHQLQGDPPVMVDPWEQALFLLEVYGLVMLTVHIEHSSLAAMLVNVVSFDLSVWSN